MTGASFLTDGALAAAKARTSVTERHQSFDHQGLWADLLSSPALAFNLFGELAAYLGIADRTVRAWWPDAPGNVRDVRFAHSPGRLDPACPVADVQHERRTERAEAVEVAQGVVTVDTKYHERIKSEVPKPENLRRYLEVAERSGAFAPGRLFREGAASA